MKAFVPANGPVNVKKYTIYAMIPGLDTYALSRLDKKKPAFQITVIAMIVICAATAFVMYQMANDTQIQSILDKDLKAQMVYEKFMPQMLLVIFGFIAMYLPIIAFLVNRWAKQWNKRFEK